jgi:hypothetical protein
MDDDKIRKHMEFIVAQQAQFGAEMIDFKSQMAELRELQAGLTRDVSDLTNSVSDLTNSVARLEAQAETDRQEIREAIDNLIIANEVTRALTEEVAKLAANTSRRVD